MGRLLEKYDEMQKKAELDKVAQERVEVISKYAELAEAGLIDVCGEGKYTKEDVIKVAQELIDQDVQEEEDMAKIAEFYEMGQIIARGFIDKVGEANAEKSNS